MNVLADDDRFFTRPRTKHTTSAGPCELPISYFDVTNVAAFFMVERQGAARLLEAPRLEPMTLGDHAVAALSFYEYRRTSIGAYNEVGLALFAVRPGERPRLGWADLARAPSRRALAAWIVDLPVTTAIACAAGRELWGYPKFVTRLPFALRGRDFDGGVLDPDGRGSIAWLSGTMGAGATVPPLSVMTYSLKDEVLLRTNVDVRNPMRLCAPGTVRLTVGTSAHPMAERLRALGLDGARPLGVARAERFQSVLHAGAPA